MQIKLTDPESVARHGEFDVLELGDLGLSSGGNLSGARLAYKTYGDLNAARDNAVLVPSAYGVTHLDSEWLIGPGKALDTERYFVICPNLFGMGLSSSPSNHPSAGSFPQVSIMDNVDAQHRLVTEVFEIEILQCVVGVSVGAIQTFHWAAAHPSMVLRVMPVCGSASASEHNRVFLQAIRGAIKLDPAWMQGEYVQNPGCGLRLVARIWAGWGLSQRYYWDQAYKELGFDSLEQFLTGFWEPHWMARDANDLLAALWTWENADIGQVPGFGGDREAALAAITAKAFVLPAETDLYFPPADQRWEAQQMPNAELRVLPGIYGHFSCTGAFPGPNRVIEDSLQELLA